MSTTPFPAAVQGLVKALRWYANAFGNATGKPTRAQKALAAWESRGRLEDDAALVRVVHDAMMEAPYDNAGFRFARAAIRAIEAALLGERVP